MRKTRAEAFSDGVFAVAATLLVFDLVDPRVKSGLGGALVSEWPSYAAYVISFSTIAAVTRKFSFSSAASNTGLPPA